MSTQAQLKTLMNTLIENGADQNKVNELEVSFNDHQVESFLDKLSASDDLAHLINDSKESPDQSNQLIDLVSELIINQ